MSLVEAAGALFGPDESGAPAALDALGPGDLSRDEFSREDIPVDNAGVSTTSRVTVPLSMASIRSFFSFPSDRAILSARMSFASAPRFQGRKSRTS